MSTDTTTIKVSSDTRDKLAAVAAETGTSIGGLIAGVAARLETKAEQDARAERTRQTLAKLGYELTPADRAAGEELWRLLDDGDDEALARAADVA